MPIGAPFQTFVNISNLWQCEEILWRVNSLTLVNTPNAALVKGLTGGLKLPVEQAG